MAEKTNKILMILVIIMIILLIIAIVMFSAVIKSTSKQNIQNEVAFKEEEKQSINIEEIAEKNELLVAVINEQNSDDGLIVIGTNTQTNNVVENNQAPYYIKVNVQANVVTIYKKDGNGNYNIPFKAMICGCGAATPVEGTYSLKKYNNWEWKTLYGREYGRYATQISGDILFHSVPYSVKGDNTTLVYQQYDLLGSISTVGSVELTVADAKWIYDNCPAGTLVNFYTEENPGPIGKPEAKKITEDEEVRGWDPTDPDSNNPWKNYVRPEKKKEEEKKDENQNKIDSNNTIMQNTTNTTNTTNSTGNNVVSENKTQNNTTTNTTTDGNNTVINTTPGRNTVVPENKVLEQNDDITITSEVIDTNSL